MTLKIAVQEIDADLVEALQGMWAKVNLNLEIDQMESGVFSQAIFGSPQQKVEQGIQCVFASWSSEDLDPDYQLGPLYQTKAWSPAGANLGFYSNPHLDELLEKAAGELNSERRTELYHQAQQIISDDAPMSCFTIPVTSLPSIAHRAPRHALLPGGRVEFDSP